ncbi:NPCBM/NEW2 domain-containing protein [Streptosporangium sp. CA-135522]|uniref:NPCBM/NEW2 domain-containing protein n=1 Tax=Streptosporangium sp. CA-135522 TaxID=3240072 RepID=UPI003D91659F
MPVPARQGLPAHPGLYRRRGARRHGVRLGSAPWRAPTAGGRWRGTAATARTAPGTTRPSARPARRAPGAGHHAYSKATHHLGDGRTRFTAKVGAGRRDRRPRPVTFKVIADGEVALTSGLLTGTTRPETPDTDIAEPGSRSWRSTTPVTATAPTEPTGPTRSSSAPHDAARIGRFNRYRPALPFVSRLL